MAKKFRIPGVSFSWKRATGITAAKQRFARATGIPTTREGRRRKFGPFGLWWLFSGSGAAVSQSQPQPSSLGGCAAGFLALIGMGFVVLVSCCGLIGLIGSSTSVTPAPNSTTAPAHQETWKAKNFQDAGIDISSRSQKSQQARQQMCAIFFANVSPPRNNVVKAELQREVRDGWYSDDVLRKNAAGMLYAYHFSDGSGTVAIFDNGKQVGTYRWANGPHYSDVSATTSPAPVPKTRPVSKPLRTSEPSTAAPSPEPMPTPMPMAPPEPLPGPTLRTWTSADGKFSTAAEFAGAIAGKVKLRKSDGAVITVDSEKLSEADHEWLRKRAK